MSIYYILEGHDPAFPRFFSTKALADWVLENNREGYGVPTQKLKGVKFDIGVHTKDQDVYTPLSYWVEGRVDILNHVSESRLAQDFVGKFFPTGLPKFHVRIAEPQEPRKLPILIVENWEGKTHLFEASIWRTDIDLQAFIESLTNPSIHSVLWEE